MKKILHMSAALIHTSKKHIFITTLVVIGLIVGSYYLLASKDDVRVADTSVHVPEVTLITANDKNLAVSFNAVGTVEAISEARLKTETGGQVTSVTTEIGKTVAAGSIIATLENKSESAQLLQAQGAYEAAVASAQTGAVGTQGAKTALDAALKSGLNTYQDAYITMDNVLHNTLDMYYDVSDEEALGFKLDGLGNTQTLIKQRTQLGTLFTQWSEKKPSVTTLTVANDLVTTHETITQLSSLVEALTVTAQNQDLSTSFKQADKDAVIASLFSVRTIVSATLKQVEGAQTQITAANNAYQQSVLSGGTNDTSAASAQVKIALGALRAAQAQYEKTLVRTPISGVVNALYIKKGDYINPNTDAALISNNKGLQIETAINQNDRDVLAIGDVVTVNEVYTGTISAIAGAVDPKTGKIAVKISLGEDVQLENGTVAKVTITGNKQANETPQNDIIVPLEAVKLIASGPVVFTVDNESKLVANTVVLGPVTGDGVKIISGISFDQKIISDARGRKAGETVTIISK